MIAEAEGFEPPDASSAPSIFKIDAINQALPNLQFPRTVEYGVFRALPLSYTVFTLWWDSNPRPRSYQEVTVLYHYGSTKSDSNRRAPAWKAESLDRWEISAYCWNKRIRWLVSEKRSNRTLSPSKVPPRRIELRTFRFSVGRSPPRLSYKGINKLCVRGDSNSQALRRQILSLMCRPIPPLTHGS